MSNTKVVFVENATEEISYENYKKLQVFMLENAEKIGVETTPLHHMTIQEFLDNDLSK